MFLPTVSKIMLLTITIYFFATRGAHAYLDPGTGSYFVQIVIASIAGGGYLLATSWGKVKKFFSNLSSRVKKPKSDEGSK